MSDSAATRVIAEAVSIDELYAERKRAFDALRSSCPPETFDLACLIDPHSMREVNGGHYALACHQLTAMRIAQRIIDAGWRKVG